MTMEDFSTPRHTRKPRKPKKPSKNFPLFRTPAEHGARKSSARRIISVRGATIRTGHAPRPLAPRKGRFAGRAHAADANRFGRRPTLGDLVNQFMVTKAALRDAGERSPRTWNAYSDACDELLAAFGEPAADRLTARGFPTTPRKWATKWGRPLAPKSPASRPSSITHGRNV